MNNEVTSLKKANDFLVEEIWRLRKIERAVNDFLKASKKWRRKDERDSKAG